MDVTVRLQGNIEGEVEIELLLLYTENDLDNYGIDVDITDFAERKYTCSKT